MKKLFQKIVTLVVLMAISFSSTVSFECLTVKKASAVNLPLGDDVYYYSDNNESIALKQRLLEEAVVDTINLNYCTTTDAFAVWLKLFYEQGTYQTIQHSYVIFEVTSYSYFDREYWESYESASNPMDFTEILYDIFERLQQNGCKIMFISDVPEAFFSRRNAFLDKVDIHIDRDQLSTFMTSIVYDVVEDFGHKKISNCTFIIDQRLSQNIELGYLSNHIFRNYFMLLIRDAYKEEMQNGQENHEVMQTNNIRFICQLDDESYFDAVGGDNIGAWNDENAIAFYEEYIANEHIYAIGSTLGTNNETEGEAWARFIGSIQDNTQNSFPIYLYNAKQYSFTDFEVDYFYQCGARSGLFYTIVVDFLTDEDLEIYNNWSGRCSITFKDIPMGSGGWMCDIFGEGEDIYGLAALFLNWDLDKDDELEGLEYEYYFGYDDSWPD